MPGDSPSSLRDATELHYLDKRVVLEQRNGVPIILGAIGPEVRKPLEYIALQHPVFGELHASLIRVTPRLVWYRQVATPNATTPTFHPEQQ